MWIISWHGNNHSLQVTYLESKSIINFLSQSTPYIFFRWWQTYWNRKIIHIYSIVFPSFNVHQEEHIRVLIEQTDWRIHHHNPQYNTANWVQSLFSTICCTAEKREAGRKNKQVIYRFTYVDQSIKEKLCPRSWVLTEAWGLMSYSRPSTQFFPITDLLPSK